MAAAGLSDVAADKVDADKEARRVRVYDRVLYKAAAPSSTPPPMRAAAPKPPMAVPASSRIPRIHVVWAPPPAVSQARAAVQAAPPAAEGSPRPSLSRRASLSPSQTAAQLDVRSNLASARAAVTSAKAAATHRQVVREQMRKTAHRKVRH